MIGTMLRINWLNLRRDRIALGLTFVMPIVFFSIFAVIFGNMGRGAGSGVGPSRQIRVIAVDEDNTGISRRFIAALAEQEALDVRTHQRPTHESERPPAYTRDEARTTVRTQDRYPVAVIVPPGFGEHFGRFWGGAGRPVELLYNPANPIAYQTVGGLLQAAAMRAAPDLLMERGLGMLESAGGTLTDTQRALVEQFKRFLRARGEATPGADSSAADDGGDDLLFGGADGLVAVKATDVRAGPRTADEAPQRSMIAYYAAGIGVMFVLFSMAGAGGSLLEEEESGTLERVLTSNVGMGKLLAANWLFFTLMGVAQLTVMFAWGAVAFDLELWTPKHLSGFAVMTLATAMAAASFGILLATLCRSRAQLQALSTIVILIMSALGGSMVPRFVMPAFMETTSRFTFNGWALDGYLKVFWYDEPGASLADSLAYLWPQLTVLAGMTVVFLAVARVTARRWEVA